MAFPLINVVIPNFGTGSPPWQLTCQCALIRTKKLMETPKVECGSVIFNLTKKTLELVECLGFQQQQRVISADISGLFRIQRNQLRQNHTEWL
jgi:hypothetical protein